MSAMFVMKTRFHRITFITALCFFGAFNPFVFASTISLPEEYSSIQEAVEDAVSGDVIQVNQDETVYFLQKKISDEMISELRSAICIVDKNIKIVGSVQSIRATIIHDMYHMFCWGDYYNISFADDWTSLQIDNSIIELKNLIILQPALIGSIFNSSAPIHIKSGKLILDNIDFTGNIIVQGDLDISNSTINGDSLAGSPDYHIRINPWKIATPALFVYNRDSPSIRIDNSTIECDTDRGARAMVFDGISNAKIRIANAIIRSGTFIANNYKSSDDYQSKDSLWVAEGRNMGLSGILIANCTNVEFDLEGSAAYGGATYGKKRIKDDYHYYPSGPGLEIIRSKKIRINGVKAVGGDGMHGGVYGVDYDKYHAADGGAGIHITNSTVTLNNVTALGGRGGEGDSAKGIEPGVDGQPIYYDENSTVVFSSAVQDWEIFK